MPSEISYWIERGEPGGRLIERIGPFMGKWSKAYFKAYNKQLAAIRETNQTLVVKREITRLEK